MKRTVTIHASDITADVRQDRKAWGDYVALRLTNAGIAFTRTGKWEPVPVPPYRIDRFYDGTITITQGK